MGQSSNPEQWLTKPAPDGRGDWIVRAGDNEAYHCLAAAAATRVSECAQFGSVATGTSDITCLDMTANEWLNKPTLVHGGDRDPELVELNVCKPTESCDISCSALVCAAGEYGTNHACTPCPAGTWNDRVGHNDAACKTCPAGQYSDTVGATACKACGGCLGSKLRLECAGAQPGWCLDTACGAVDMTCWVGANADRWSVSPRSWSKGALPTRGIGARVENARGGPVIATRARAASLTIVGDDNVVEITAGGMLDLQDSGDAVSTTTTAALPPVPVGHVDLDFSPFVGEVLIDFDLGCKAVAPPKCVESDLTNAYRAQGVTFKNTAQVFSAAARSPGFGAANGPLSAWGNAPMSFTYDRGASNVGFYYSGPDADMSVTVTDCAGKDFHFTITNNGLGRPDAARFFGVRAACLKTFVVSGGGYLIDDLRWNNAAVEPAISS